MRTIGPVTLRKSVEAIEGMLATHAREINEAYLAQDQELTVNISLKFQASAKGAIAITHKISFVKDKVSDGDTTYADEKQMPMFDSQEIFAAAAGELAETLNEGESVQVNNGPKLVKRNGKVEAA
jgi:hypothetical protein